MGKETTKNCPHAPVRQLDSVEGVRGGAVLLTIHFVQQELQLTFLRPANDSQSVIDIFETLYLALRPDIFLDLCKTILGNKSPYDVFSFQYGYEILNIFGLLRIPPDEIILTPKVFKQQ